ncbi:hypothetical protein [Caproiciproducens sp. CPB-2]|uniref:hypothetical protein n=1 Tax=Caproiciproducens sp. CPB-2 TaxID=3030017 RepID=UPI0023DAA1E8|nr:hypothetical protein [Caproiciproducens sp. CPB-2]MDF1495347.1 hypothetical protein [Caproiciproducens sp. CPB-2]
MKQNHRAWRSKKIWRHPEHCYTVAKLNEVFRCGQIRRKPRIPVLLIEESRNPWFLIIIRLPAAWGDRK